MDQNGKTGKVIRFYANVKPREIMDDLTIEDLKEAGFVAYRYKGTKDPKTLRTVNVEDPKRLVHASVPVAETIQDANYTEYPHPVIRYEFGFGWEAKFGAIRYSLRNQKELHAFMNAFNYPIPNEQDS